jgi:hypothetical protein
MENTIPIEYAKDYILAGRAMVGIHSTLTGNTFWYFVKQKDKGEHNEHWNVYVRGGSYIGTIREMQGGWFFVPSGPVRDNPATEPFLVAWHRIRIPKDHPQLIILHMGTCSFCGRQLTDGDSLLKGIGPICRKKLGII